MCLTYRGDHKEPEKRKPIPTKIIAGMLETAGTSQVNPVSDNSDKSCQQLEI